MEADHPISLLMIMSFVIPIGIAVAALIYFMRKRSNRHPMDGQRERNVGQMRDDGPNP